MEDNFRRVPPPPPPRPPIPPQYQPHQAATETPAPQPQTVNTQVVSEPEKAEKKKGLSPALVLTLKIAGAVVSLGLAVFFLYMLIS